MPVISVANKSQYKWKYIFLTGNGSLSCKVLASFQLGFTTQAESNLLFMLQKIESALTLLGYRSHFLQIPGSKPLDRSMKELSVPRKVALKHVNVHKRTNSLPHQYWMVLTWQHFWSPGFAYRLRFSHHTACPEIMRQLSHLITLKQGRKFLGYHVYFVFFCDIVRSIIE